MEARFQIIWIYLLLLVRELTIHKTSKYLGVSFCKKLRSWKVVLHIHNKKINLGSYKSEKEAALAYDQAKLFFDPQSTSINIGDVLPRDPSMIRKNSLENKRPGKKISIFRGVHWYAATNTWMVRFMENGISHFVGYFKDEIEAAKNYDRVARYFTGEKALTNFKETDSASPSKIRDERTPKTSPYIGVHLPEGCTKWIASIHINRKTKRIGGYSDEIEAAKAYNREAVKLGRPLNIIPENSNHAL